MEPVQWIEAIGGGLSGAVIVAEALKLGGGGDQLAF